MNVPVLVFVGLLSTGVVGAQAPPPPVQPPATQPPVTQPPATQPPVTQPPVTPPPAGQPPVVAPPVTPAPTPATVSAPAAPVTPPAVSRVELSDADIRTRRDAIFLMEGLLVNSVKLAAGRTQREIEAAQPDLRVTLFTQVPPEARGTYLEDYGVFFQVQIPTYQPSVVSLMNMLPTVPGRPRADTAAASRAGGMNPDATYVGEVQLALTNAMLEHSKALDLRPTEWLTVAARGEDGSGGPASEPSVMILRVRGGDLIEYFTGRLSRDEVRKRVEIRGFSGR